jgi:hypothetical protein
LKVICQRRLLEFNWCGSRVDSSDGSLLVDLALIRGRHGLVRLIMTILIGEMENPWQGLRISWEMCFDCTIVIEP